MVIDVGALATPRRFCDDSAADWLDELNVLRRAAGLPSARLVPEAHTPQGLLVSPVELLAALAVARQAALGTPANPLSSHFRMLGTVVFNLALFDAWANPLELDPDVESIRGRARSLVSEDLGIAVGVHVATRLLARQLPTSHLVDVDNPPPRYAVEGNHRPDYLVVSGTPPSGTGTVEVVLECKGRSRTGARVETTFFKALDQAEQTRLADVDEVPRPVAVGALRGTGDLEFLAVEPDPHDPPVPLREPEALFYRPEDPDEPPAPNEPRRREHPKLSSARDLEWERDPRNRMRDKLDRLKTRRVFPHDAPTVAAGVELHDPLVFELTVEPDHGPLTAIFGMATSVARRLQTGVSTAAIVEATRDAFDRAELQRDSTHESPPGFSRAGTGTVTIGDRTLVGAVAVTTSGYVLAVGTTG